MIQLERRAGGTYCGSQEPEASGREWMLGIPKSNGRNGFFRQICRINLFSGASHIFQTQAAERLAAPFPTHCC